jgi:hypothetical protein
VDFSKLERGEIIAAVSGLFLAISVFLTWYSTDSGNPNSNVDGMKGDLSAWDVHSIIRFLLLAAAAAPLILGWIIIRQHELSWPKGEVTAVVASTALVLILVVGIISRPGEPRSTISLQIGWYLGVLACIGMLVGAAWRSAEGQTKKPPGTL